MFLIFLPALLVDFYTVSLFLSHSAALEMSHSIMWRGQSCLMVRILCLESSSEDGGKSLYHKRLDLYLYPVISSVY